MISHFLFFFFNDTATTEIYTLSLHDALPIFVMPAGLMRYPRALLHQRKQLLGQHRQVRQLNLARVHSRLHLLDRKSTRLNSSHSQISYAVFCLKKKKKITQYFSTTNNTANTT